MPKSLLVSQADAIAAEMDRAAGSLGQLRRSSPHISSELLIIGVSLFFTLFCNALFWSELLKGRSWSSVGTWVFAGIVFAVLTALHSVLLGLVVSRWTAKPALAGLFIVTALAVYYMNRYTVFFDPGMVRNILHTDVKEASELLSSALLANLAMYGVLPCAVLWRVKLQKRSWRRAIITRAAFMIGAVVIAIGGIALVFQDMSALMRNHKEMRYLITPGNYIMSATRVLSDDMSENNQPRIPIGTDAALAASWAMRIKPALLVVVVGETARAANWGLNGYARQTTPKLAQADVINFSQVNSCGTNTEVSVPCMFSPFGRKDYDARNIRQHESLLHVLEHGGFKTLWRDNQSGCKGVCDGLEQQRLDGSSNPALCDGDRCLDEILLENLDAELQKSTRNMVIVLHQLGNHGPAYSRRYPEAFRQFAPTCDTADLGKCSQREIINSYDNALLYTDYFLDQTIRTLKKQTTHDAAMIYVSDHGESLGERGIYLHGMPYAISPKEQTKVPMVMWLSPGFSSSFGIDIDCMKKKASREISHDYLFHSVLGMLQIQTQVYDKSYDLATDCHV